MVFRLLIAHNTWHSFLYMICMALLEKFLFVKKSSIPQSGKGLFCKKMIPKGTRIVEYKGKMTTWKLVDHDEGKNGYIYYINRNLVIDAYNNDKTFGRYANDARGLSRKKGINNNSEYVIDGRKVFIESLKDIPAGQEILVGYGKEYWDVIRYNYRLSLKEKKNAKTATHSPNRKRKTSA